MQIPCLCKWALTHPLMSIIIDSMNGHNEIAEKAASYFKPLLLASFAIAGATLALPLLVRPGNTDPAIKVSACLASFWGVLVMFAFWKFRRRALWFLLGTPFIGFWFFVLFLIAWGCAHNVKACP